MGIDINVRSYTRRDGVLMAYINGDNDKSVGVSEEKQPTSYGKGGTKGTRNVIESFWRAVSEAPDARVHEGSPVQPQLHDEDHFDAGDWWGHWYITDVAKVGGAEVHEAGFYLWIPRMEKLLNLDKLGRRG